MARLKGQVALVTGASSGIGRAIALAMAAEGADVVLVARRRELLEQVAEETRTLGSSALVCPGDVTDVAAVDALVPAVLARFGRLDILVNVAGGNVQQRSLAEVVPQSWHAVVDVNLTSAFLCTRAALTIMRQQRRGTIINMASFAAKQPAGLAGAAYCAAKSALVTLNESINLEERQHGIRSCVICPGEVDTPILDLRPRPPTAAARATMLKPEDVAAAAVFVATLPDRATIEEMVIRPTVLRNLAADALTGTSTTAR